VSGSSSAIVGKAVFEWNDAPLWQRDVRHDGDGPQKLPRAGAALARIAECIARRREAHVPYRPPHYRPPEFTRVGVRPLWGH